MAFETLLLEREESFVVITLNRPPANAISETLIRELNAALSSVQSDGGVRVVIITGRGDRIFCGGADLGSAFAGGDVEAFIRFGNSVMRKMERFPKPIIAAINGHAMGGGCEIAMACHLRLLKETARMGQTESNLGIIPGYGGTQRLPRLIGRTKALEYLLLGTQIPAVECLALGLVNRLCKDGETLNDAKALARQLAKRAPLATAAIIKAVDEGLESPMARSIDVEIDAFLPTLHSEDAAEGIQAFFAKREPEFKGALVDLGIAGKVALVTGSARSLGKADAVMLAAEGCKVAIVDLNAEGAEETARELAAGGAAVRGYACDIRDTALVQDTVARIERELGPVDICVNNAGMIYTVGQLKDMRDEDWEFNLGVNLTGTMKVTRAVFPGMRERRWGRIVCMASIAGLMGGFGQTAYSTSKIGIIGFAKSVALEGARYNVTCNAVAPGIVAPNASLSPLYERMVKRVAMQREGQPEDVASAIAFLCSERARYITGAVLTVTGGMDLFTF